MSREQWDALQADLRLRAASRKDAAIDLLVAVLDRDLLLTGRQRQEISATVANTRPPGGLSHAVLEEWIRVNGDALVARLQDFMARYPDRTFDSAESDLRSGWDRFKLKSRLAWDKAKYASRDAWDRIDSKVRR